MKRKKFFFQTAGSMGSSLRGSIGCLMVGFAWLPVVCEKLMLYFLRLCQYVLHLVNCFRALLKRFYIFKNVSLTLLSQNDKAVLCAM